MNQICKTCGKNHETYYTKENFPSLKYGPGGSPNPPHMRGVKPKELNPELKEGK